MEVCMEVWAGFERRRGLARRRRSCRLRLRLRLRRGRLRHLLGQRGAGLGRVRIAPKSAAGGGVGLGRLRLVAKEAEEVLLPVDGDLGHPLLLLRVPANAAMLGRRLLGRLRRRGCAGHRLAYRARREAPPSPRLTKPVATRPGEGNSASGQNDLFSSTSYPGCGWSSKTSKKTNAVTMH